MNLAEFNPVAASKVPKYETPGCILLHSLMCRLTVESIVFERSNFSESAMELTSSAGIGHLVRRLSFEGPVPDATCFARLEATRTIT